MLWLVMAPWAAAAAKKLEPLPITPDSSFSTSWFDAVDENQSNPLASFAGSKRNTSVLPTPRRLSPMPTMMVSRE